MMALLAAWPYVVVQMDKYGSIPLHDELVHDASKAVVMALLAVWPNAVKEESLITLLNHVAFIMCKTYTFSSIPSAGKRRWYCNRLH